MTDTALTTTDNRPKPPSVTAGGNVGALIPQDIEQAFRIASALAHSKMTPRGFESPEACFVAIMAGAELGLPPFQALQSFAIINNRPTLWGDALVAVIRTNGFTMREWYEGEGDDLTAFCEVTRPDNGDTAEGEFSVADAKKAGLWTKTGPWQTSPKRMLKMRARAFAIRDGAADVLRGFQIREEIEDYGEAIAVETPRQGTGLLAKLQSNETLAEEGFGIRNLETEAGEAAPAAEPPKKRGRPPKAKSVAQQALDAMPDALSAIAEAEPEIVQRALEEEAALSDSIERGRQHYDKAENPPADAEVEETASVTPEPTQEPSEPVSESIVERTVNAAYESIGVTPGYAEPGELYFLATEPAFASGRRACYRDGLPVDSVDDGQHPVYTEHAPRKVAARPTETASASNAEAEPGTSGSANDASTDLREGTSGPQPSDGNTDGTAHDLFGADETPADPFEAFEAALTVAKSWPDLRPALVELSKSEAWKARPNDARRVRCDVWDIVNVWNEAGAKLDPATDAYLFQAFVTASADLDAIEGTFALAQDESWFKAASPEMQAGVGRFVLNRTTAIRGG